jgi:uncharacterized membrane protein YphA (DoxX/SURF4 family)
MDFFTSPYFILYARLCVGGVFLVSAVTKMMDREGTAVAMSRYPFLPSGFGRFVAYTLPYLELLVGGMLVFGLFTRLAALAAAAMFVLFTVLTIYDLTRGQSSSCHCFGRLSSEKLTPMAVVRNAVLFAFSLLVFAAFDGWMSVDAALNGSAGAGLLIANDRTGALPDAANSVPVILLATATVAAIVLGGQAIATVRNTLRGLSPR